MAKRRTEPPQSPPVVDRAAVELVLNTLKRILGVTLAECAASTQAQTPAIPPEEDWVSETPDQCFGYWLVMEDNSDWIQDIELTRAEFIALKQRLAELRGYVPKTGVRS